jgi:anti-anti-sigma factor
MSQKTYDYFELDRAGDVAVFRLAVKEMRHPHAAQEFGTEVRAALQESGLKHALIDMDSVEYVGSTAFATLLNLAKAVTAGGGLLKLCELHPDVRVGANILGLGHAVEIFDDRNTALKSFAAPRSH